MNNKDIKYIGKDFESLRDLLIDYSKTYFPNTYTDFSNESVGMLLLELSAYVGDVLSFYTDVQLRESLLSYAKEKKRVIALAKDRGYKIKTSTPSISLLDVSIVLPATLDDNNESVPDTKLAPIIRENSVVKSSNGILFRTLSSIDFSDLEDASVSVYKIDSSTGAPTSFIVKKQVHVAAGTLKTVSFVCTEFERNKKLYLPDTDVIEIVSAIDSDNNVWYEVQNLAQREVFVEDAYSSVVNKLRTIYANRKFVVEVDELLRTCLRFGNGDNVDITKYDPKRFVLPYTSPQNIVKADTNLLTNFSTGISPTNTTLFVTYVHGGGLVSDVAANTITKIVKLNTELDSSLDLDELERSVYDKIIASVIVNNPIPATGGKDADTLEEIRDNAIAYSFSQNRVVTDEDYENLILSMPAKYGAVAKTYVSNNEIVISNSMLANPINVDIYVLSYNARKNFVAPNEIVKQNIKSYLSKYRILTDSVHIHDVYVINIGINFSIHVYSGYQKKEVIAKCISRLSEVLSNDNMKINSPIIIGSLVHELTKVAGVQNVAHFDIHNLYDDSIGYSKIRYDINLATKNNIVYPPKDIAIFEIKFPTVDIKGKAL